MYTQRVKDGELVDSVPWRESITMTAGIKGCSIDQNIDNVDGMTKQLMRVSTRGGGGDVRKYAVGTSLRDFALVVAASQGIDQVVCGVVLAQFIFVHCIDQLTSSHFILSIYAVSFSAQSHVPATSLWRRKCPHPRFQPRVIATRRSFKTFARIVKLIVD